MILVYINIRDKQLVFQDPKIVGTTSQNIIHNYYLAHNVINLNYHPPPLSLSLCDTKV